MGFAALPNFTERTSPGNGSSHHSVGETKARAMIRGGRMNSNGMARSQRERA